MAEHKAFTCDAGCGSHVALTPPATSERDFGWFTILTPKGWPSAQVCSPECLARWAHNASGSMPRLSP